MSNEKSNDKKSKNILKNATKGVNDVFHKSVDTANDTIKKVSGEGGIIGKASDTASDAAKGISNTGKGIVDKTVDTSSDAYKGVKKKVTNRNKDQ
ncbi:hypothetical protein [Pseudalkalibacillus berkeleyi]|uniref:Uncharacterized protein n=1 Tax=Pseudalkalibacillus berkeleyi TaxID=1069813 RepID=A0ABS9H5G9_9BACL|nr:hypothetical protein [Pseudalkalibacillus berkeleyi]MCF6139040.1 hypothetical protein [Pseudalkalibacillus berkeleyi]